MMRRPINYSMSYSKRYHFATVSTKKSSSLMVVSFQKTASNLMKLEKQTDSRSQVMRASCVTAFGPIHPISTEGNPVREASR